MTTTKREIRRKQSLERKAGGHDFISYYRNRAHEIVCFWTWPFGHAYPDEFDSESRCVGCGKIQGTIPQW